MKEPVASLIQPTRKGPTKPPREPIVEINASPPAAPRPVKNVVGIVQKIARADEKLTSTLSLKPGRCLQFARAKPSGSV
jgi:hypothetical protein